VVQLSLKNVSEMAHISRRKKSGFLSLTHSLSKSLPRGRCIATDTTKYITGTAATLDHNRSLIFLARLLLYTCWSYDCGLIGLQTSSVTTLTSPVCGNSSYMHFIILEYRNDYVISFYGTVSVFALQIHYM